MRVGVCVCGGLHSHTQRLLFGNETGACRRQYDLYDNIVIHS